LSVGLHSPLHPSQLHEMVMESECKLATREFTNTKAYPTHTHQGQGPQTPPNTPTPHKSWAQSTMSLQTSSPVGLWVNLMLIYFVFLIY